MTDVRLFHTSDGGDIELAGDGLSTEVALNNGLETAAYLSLFGGNERHPGRTYDNGTDQRPHSLQWWGNHGEPEARKQTSETQHLIRELPPSSGNLRRLEDAAVNDLQWFKDEKIVSEVEATASLITSTRVSLLVQLVVDTEEFDFAFETDWGN